MSRQHVSNPSSENGARHSRTRRDDLLAGDAPATLLPNNPLLDDEEDDESGKGKTDSIDLPESLSEDDEALPSLDIDGVLPSGAIDTLPLVDLSESGDVVFNEKDSDSILLREERDEIREASGSSSDPDDDGSRYESDERPYSGGGDSLEDILAAADMVSDNAKEKDNGTGQKAEPDEIDRIIEASQSGFSTSYGDEKPEDELAGFNLDEVISSAIQQGASDIHLSSDSEIAFTILGDIVRQPQFGVISHTIAQRVYTRITSHVAQSSFAENLELDTAYVVKTGKDKGRRLRLSVGRSFNAVFMVFRVISDVIPTPEQLGIKDEIKQWTKLPNGLVLVCGPTGTGKSTTFASLIQRIQMERPQKIITIEKPIEYVYGTGGKAFITQREVGSDARSFSNALTSAMRQAPDIIMVGEVRNREEVDELLRASETGHLAVSTMHTNSPAATITRIKSLYEGDEQLRVLGSLKDNVRGIANQVLVKTKDGASRFAVQSVLNVDDEVSSLIGRGDSDAIEKYMRDRGTTMEHELLKAVEEGRCSYDEAMSKTPSPSYFERLAKDML